MELMQKKNKELLESKNQEDLIQFNSDITTLGTFINLNINLFWSWLFLESQMQSLKSKGFLRAYKNYEPPADLETKFLSCVSDSLQKNITDLTSVQNMEISSPELKLKLINSLNREFSHKVHNSRLHQMKTIGDLLVYYKVKLIHMIWL